MSTEAEQTNSPSSNSETPPNPVSDTSTTTTETTGTTTPETPPAPEPLTAEAIKFQEGFTVDEAVRDEFIGIMNDDKLTPAERAQKLVDIQQNLAKSWSDSLTQDWEKQRDIWREEVKADPEVGGDKTDRVLADISKVILEYGSPEIADILTNTGAGDNVHMVKMMYKIAKALNEGTGHVTGNPPPSEKTTAQKLYPSMK